MAKCVLGSAQTQMIGKPLFLPLLLSLGPPTPAGVCNLGRHTSSVKKKLFPACWLQKETSVSHEPSGFWLQILTVPANEAGK